METEKSELSDFMGSLATVSRRDNRFVVLYDGACYFCVFTVKYLQKIDFLHQFDPLTLQEYSEPGKTKIPYSILQESIHVIDRKTGMIWNSTKAISKLLLRSPPAFPLLIVLLFLRIIRIAEPAYHWVAQSRYAISSMLQNEL